MRSSFLLSGIEDLRVTGFDTTNEGEITVSRVSGKRTSFSFGAPSCEVRCVAIGFDLERVEPYLLPTESGQD